MIVDILFGCFAVDQKYKNLRLMDDCHKNNHILMHINTEESSIKRSNFTSGDNSTGYSKKPFSDSKRRHEKTNGSQKGFTVEVRHTVHPQSRAAAVMKTWMKTTILEGQTVTPLSVGGQISATAKISQPAKCNKSRSV